MHQATLSAKDSPNYWILTYLVSRISKREVKWGKKTWKGGGRDGGCGRTDEW